MPAIRELEDGTKLLAEAKAFLVCVGGSRSRTPPLPDCSARAHSLPALLHPHTQVLERNVHTKKCGAYCNEHTVQLVRMHTDAKGRPSFKLVVQPR